MASFQREERRILTFILSGAQINDEYFLISQDGQTKMIDNLLICLKSSLLTAVTQKGKKGETFISVNDIFICLQHTFIPPNNKSDFYLTFYKHLNRDKENIALKLRDERRSRKERKTLTRLSLPHSKAGLHVPPSNWTVLASQSHII